MIGFIAAVVFVVNVVTVYVVDVDDVVVVKVAFVVVLAGDVNVDDGVAVKHDVAVADFVVVVVVKTMKAEAPKQTMANTDQKSLAT